MSNRPHVLPLGFGLSAVFCLAAPGTTEEAARPAVRVYTNEDLERVRPFRDETGVRSVPAVTPSSHEARTERAGARERERSRGRGEEYWRREAEKTRDRVRRLAEQADGLRAQVAQEDAQHEAQQRHFSTHGRRGSTLTTDFDRRPGLRARLAALEQRARFLEEDLADRARREGALPGWLR